jgi:hypothetical protein
MLSQQAILHEKMRPYFLQKSQTRTWQVSLDGLGTMFKSVLFYSVTLVLRYSATLNIILIKSYINTNVERFGHDLFKFLSLDCQIGGLRRTTTNLRIACVRVLNLPEHETEVSTTRPRLLVRVLTGICLGRNISKSVVIRLCAGFTVFHLHNPVLWRWRDN